MSRAYTFRPFGMNTYASSMEWASILNEWANLFSEDGYDGNLNAAGGTFSGELIAATGTFTGALSAATGTFAGSLSAATGTFSGDISAASGTFSGTISSNTFTAATAAFAGSMTVGFNITANGNLAIGSGAFIDGIMTLNSLIFRGIGAVTFMANDSGDAGYRLLQVPNA